MRRLLPLFPSSPSCFFPCRWQANRAPSKADRSAPGNASCRKEPLRFDSKRIHCISAASCGRPTKSWRSMRNTASPRTR